MKSMFAASIALVLSGCVVPEDAQGSVYEITDETVTIRGAFSMDMGASGPARPTAAMVAQANDICPGATYLSATPSPTDDYTFLYLFRCP